MRSPRQTHSPQPAPEAPSYLPARTPCLCLLDPSTKRDTALLLDHTGQLPDGDEGTLVTAAIDALRSGQAKPATDPDLLAWCALVEAVNAALPCTPSCCWYRLVLAVSRLLAVASVCDGHVCGRWGWQDCAR